MKKFIQHTITKGRNKGQSFEYYVPNELLGQSSPKTEKNALRTRIMYLSPASGNSFNINLCKGHGSCVDTCLNWAGRGKLDSTQLARLNKTNYYLADKIGFINQLHKEVKNFDKLAKRNGKTYAIRFNGTSDVDFIADIKNICKVNVLTEYTNIKFYDYTKIIGRIRKYQGQNYSLTFSRDEANHDHAMEALSLGYPISAVFENGIFDDNGKQIITNFLGYPVVDGDKADDIMVHNSGAYVLGLKFKGTKKDKFQGVASGFVISAFELSKKMGQ